MCVLAYVCKPMLPTLYVTVLLRLIRVCVSSLLEREEQRSHNISQVIFFIFFFSWVDVFIWINGLTWNPSGPWPFHFYSGPYLDFSLRWVFAHQSGALKEPRTYWHDDTFLSLINVEFLTTNISLQGCGALLMTPRTYYWGRKCSESKKKKRKNSQTDFTLVAILKLTSSCKQANIH